MFLFQLFRSFLPLHNPIGFGARDFLELAAAALLVVLILARAALAAAARRLAEHPAWCMALLAALPVVLRLALWAQSPVPAPNGVDDYAYLLSGDTLRHFRLANPPHPWRQFFETIFVLQEPSYSSIFPIGPGIALAAGQMIFGYPWAGVVLSVAALCALCYWMLRGWTTPGWALTGGLLAVIEFGPLRYWMNSYWGGALAGVAGCLVFGALPRLRARWRTRDAVLLGLGIGVHLLTRPFESVLLLLAVGAFFAAQLRGALEWQKLARAMPAVLLAVAPAAAVLLLQNQQVTGSWTTLPYVLSRYQYGVPTTFTVQANPVPHKELTPDQQLDYDVQAEVHGPAGDSPRKYLERLAGRVRFYRFFFLAPLYLAMPFFLFYLRELRFAWVAFALLVFGLGANFYPYFYPHYIAALTCLFLLVSVKGLERLSRLQLRGFAAGQEAGQLIVMLCAAHFLFWYGFHLFANDNASIAMRQYETWEYVNHGDPGGRAAVRDQLSRAGGKQLVFVRYWPQHKFDAWVQNAADIDRAAIVWALDRGAAENEKLRHYYPDRSAWLLEPDARPPKLAPYEQPAAPVVQPEKPSPEMNGIQLLPVQ